VRVILVDDESIALDALAEMLEGFGHIEILGKYCSPKRFLEEFSDKKPDVVFLDIEMPVIDGFTVAEEMIHIAPNTGIVFVTAYNEYAIKAFEINAIDYVLKPISKERLISTVNRIKNNNIKGINNYKTVQEIGLSALKKGLKKVTVWKDERIFLINPADILYCFSRDKEVNVITKEGSVYKSRYSLSILEEKLKAYKFFRCHKSFIVNINKVEEVIPEVNSIYLLKICNSKEEIPVSRSYLKQFKNLIDI
jgi:DNA-binding LytR/AlgR family response regulator